MDCPFVVKWWFMRIMFVSLGCDKNLVDSEMMMGLLAKRGHTFTDDIEEAEAAVINTCGFISDAKEESINTILEMAEYKNKNLRYIIAAGCLAQRYADTFMDELPEVDAIVGTTAFDQICETLDRLDKGAKQVTSIENIDRSCRGKEKRIISTPGNYYSYLKIAEGCNKRCTYCAIPYIRGSYRSVPMEELIAEAEELVDQGIKELILVAQETTLYGIDLYGKKSLTDLLNKLCEIEGLKWIRILYCYPEEITDELIDTIANQPKICHYLDIPIQHASDDILRRMGRRTDNKYLREIIGKLRERIPDIAIRTTVITGFPGETDEDHQVLLDFIDDMEFERLGCFTYSPEDDTPAALYDHQVDEDLKAKRRDEVMSLQQEISLDICNRNIGRILDALIVGRDSENGEYIARTYMDAPDVDGYIFFESERDLISGDMVRLKVTGALEYDLIGELL